MIIKITEKGIGRSELSALGFSKMEEYFDNILLSNVEGQQKEAARYFEALNVIQRKDCLQYFRSKLEEYRYFKDLGFYPAYNNILSLCINHIY